MLKTECAFGIRILMLVCHLQARLASFESAEVKLDLFSFVRAVLQFLVVLAACLLAMYGEDIDDAADYDEQNDAILDEDHKMDFSELGATGGGGDDENDISADLWQVCLSFFIVKW